MTEKRATVHLMGSTALGQLLALLIAPLLGRLLGPEAFGAFGVYLAVLGVLGGAASWRLGLAVPQPLEEDEAIAVLGAGVFATLMSAVLVTLLLWVGAQQIAAALRAPEVEPLLWWIPVSIIGVGFTDVISGWCLRHREFPALVRQRVVRAVGTSGWQLGHAFLAPLSAVPLVIGEAIGRFASVLAMWGVLWRSESQRLRQLSWSRISAALATKREFTLVATPSYLLNQLGQWIPVVLLTFWWGPVAAGLYVVGQRIVGVPIGLIGDSAGQVYIAQLAAQSRSEPSAMPTLFSETAKRLAGLAVLTAGALILLGPLAFRLGFGADWVDAGRMVRWQGIALAAQLVAIPMAHTLVVLQFQRRQLFWDVSRLLATTAGFGWAQWHGMDSVAAVAIHGGITAVLYLALTWTSWGAVRIRAQQPADARV